MIELTLPYPISSNRYWTQFWNPKLGHVMSGPSTEATKYKKAVAKIAQAAGVEPIKGRVKVGIMLYPFRPQDWAKRARENPLNWDDDVRCLDLDNVRKVIYDSLKDIAFEDDKFIFEDWGKRCEPDSEGGRAVVCIEPIIQEEVQPALFESPMELPKNKIASTTLPAKPF